LNKNDIQLVTHQENEGITDFYCHFVVRDCVLLLPLELVVINNGTNIISHLVATPVVDASYNGLRTEAQSEYKNPLTPPRTKNLPQTKKKNLTKHHQSLNHFACYFTWSQF